MAAVQSEETGCNRPGIQPVPAVKQAHTCQEELTHTQDFPERELMACFVRPAVAFRRGGGATAGDKAFRLVGHPSGAKLLEFRTYTFNKVRRVERSIVWCLTG